MYAQKETPTPGEGSRGQVSCGICPPAKYAARPVPSQLDDARRQWQAAHCRFRAMAEIVSTWRRPEFWPAAEQILREYLRAADRYRRIRRKLRAGR